MDDSILVSDQSVGDMTVNNIPFDRQIPVYDYKAKDLLSLSDRKLAKFFKCCPNTDPSGGDGLDNQCFYGTNDTKQFEQHLRDCHQRVCCFYCRFGYHLDIDADNDSYDTTQSDQLIEHMVRCHGHRIYQCNRCHFRAITTTHIQMHQIARHTRVWTTNNSKISIEALDEPNDDICKIIVCKAIDLGPIVDPSLLLAKYRPNLYDVMLDEDKRYCLYCDFNDTHIGNVLVHSAETHPDFIVTAFNTALEDMYKLNDELEDESDAVVVSEDDSDLSDSDVESELNAVPKLSAPFRTQCTTECSADIPGLSDDFLPPMRQQLNAKRRLPFSGHRQHERVYENYKNHYNYSDNRMPYPIHRPSEPQFSNDIPDSYDDDFSRPFTPITPIANTPQPVPTPQRVPTPQPIPTPQPNISSNIPLSQTYTMSQKPNTTLPKRVAKSVPKTNEISGYRLHKLNKYGSFKVPKINGKNSGPLLTSTPNSESSNATAGDINIGMIYSDLNMTEEDTTRSNSFKNHKRVGVPAVNTKRKTRAFTYVPHSSADEYVDLLNETSVPKRGVKARFENRHQPEGLFTPGVSAPNAKNTFKCDLCPNELPFRDYRIHLRNNHNTDCSVKCGYCLFFGPIGTIKEHSKVCHPSQSENIHKFITSLDQTSIRLTKENRIKATTEKKLTARKSTASGTGLVSKGGKGALTQKILSNHYVDLGPQAKQLNSRKRTNDPTKRVYSRSKHSSNIKRRKMDTMESMDVDEDINAMAFGDDLNLMPSDIESDEESDYNEFYNEEEVEESEPEGEMCEPEEEMSEPEVLSPLKHAFARKSTAKPSQSEGEVSVPKILDETDIPSKYFCVFCEDTIEDKWKAIEHYKTHLRLGYQCSECRFHSVVYKAMEEHWTTVHMSDKMDFEDNMTDDIRLWILNCLDNQFKSSMFVESTAINQMNSNGINIYCFFCEKAAQLCGLRAAPFDALWKVKLHICKHLHWLPMKCNLCVVSNRSSNICHPNHPWVLMKHLVTDHFNSCDNLYNIAFRGQKAFNDMKREQLRLIDRHFTSIRVFSSDIINSFFMQLMTQLDMTYENQLRHKFSITKDIRINLERCIHVKDEPIDDYNYGVQQEDKKDIKPEDKKDVKLLVKNEVKSEVKSEVKAEVKSEVKNELKNEVKDEMKDESMSEEPNFLEQLYGQSFEVQDNDMSFRNQANIIILDSDSDDN